VTVSIALIVAIKKLISR